MEEYKEIAIALWSIINDIDTYSDMAKGDDKLYRSLVEKKQKERFKYLWSDGYDLFLPDGDKITNENESILTMRFNGGE